MKTTYTNKFGFEYPLPGARNISNVLLEIAKESDLSKTISHMLPLWGQFLDHDVTKTPTVEPVIT